MAEQAALSGWAILELMGHRRLAGFVVEQEIAGVGLLRLDVPGEGDGTHKVAATLFFHPNAIYCLTPTTEETARAVAQSNVPAPVARWELPALGAPKLPVLEDREPPSVCVECGDRLSTDEYRLCYGCIDQIVDEMLEGKEVDEEGLP